MAYLALYRKYRPQTFEEIKGQEHVTRTLQNAVTHGRVAHAYLFCGPRGTAKTTTARVLAKAMNCEHGPTATPCDRCDPCERIREGRSLDVVEVDAASNRGIDDIKLLREQVGRASAQERCKFYIIDEVHQLSADAFQALLKTLEEPPPNVIFVLATTETQRVPRTIVSRCQRFDFRRGTIEDLTEILGAVTAAERIAAEPAALTAIARAAGGGWRDALSILEQVAAYSPDKLDRASVDSVLGSVDEATLFTLADAIGAGDSRAVFEELHRLMGEGKEPRQILGSLAAHLRDLLWIQSGAGSSSAADADSAEDSAAQAGRLPGRLLLRTLDAIQKAESQMRWIADQRLLVEITLLRATAAATERAGTAAPPSSQAPSESAPRNRVGAPAPPSPAREHPPVAADTNPDLPSGDAAAIHGSGLPEANADPMPSTTKSEGPDAVPSDVGPDLKRLWGAALSELRPNVRALLKDAVPLRIVDRTLEVGFRHKTHVRLIEQRPNRDLVDQALKKQSPLDLRMKPVILDPEPVPNPGSADGKGGHGFLGDDEFIRLFGAKEITEGET